MRRSIARRSRALERCACVHVRMGGISAGGGRPRQEKRVVQGERTQLDSKSSSEESNRGMRIQEEREREEKTTLIMTKRRG